MGMEGSGTKTASNEGGKGQRARWWRFPWEFASDTTVGPAGKNDLV